MTKFYENILGGLKKGDVTKDFGKVLSRSKYRGQVKVVTEKQIIINSYYFPVVEVINN